MKRSAVHASAGRTAHDNRRGGVPKIMALGDEIGELVEAASDEIDELHFADGAQAEIAHAAGGADDGALADGRVDHALPAETLEQAFAGLESAAVHANVFADDHDRGVALHLLKHGLFDGFEECHRAVATIAARRIAIGFAAGHRLSPLALHAPAKRPSSGSAGDFR